MVVLLGLIALFVTGVAGAQGMRPETASFRVEWQRREGGLALPVVEGYVYNNSEYRVGNVRLRVEVVDASGHRVDEKTVWVPAIDARGRGYFAVAPPKSGQAYQITVESFDLIARQVPRDHDLQTP